MTRPPCYDEIAHTDCQHRHVGCHADCEAYHKWMVIHNEELETVRRKKQSENEVNEFLILQNERTRKSNQSKREREKRRMQR